MNVFEAVKQFVTTREVAEFYGFSVNRAGMIACPFHNDRTPSMKVDKRFHCFGCGADGDAVDFIARLFGKGTKEAAEMIATDFALAYDRNGKPPVLPKAREPTAEQKFEAEEKRCFRVLSDYFHKLRAWETDYAPKQPEDEWHKLFYNGVPYVIMNSTTRNLKGAFSMASKKVEMYAKKRYELDEIKNKIKEEFDKRKFSDVEFKDEIIRELGDTKTLLLIFENWFLRTGSYASLVIMLSEYQGYQSADIIATGGKEAFFSFGAEGDFAKFGEDALKNLGFQGKVR